MARILLDLFGLLGPKSEAFECWDWVRGAVDLQIWGTPSSPQISPKRPF